MMVSMNATNDKNAMRLAAIFSTNMMAVEAPCEAASKILASWPFSSLISSMVVLDFSSSGKNSLETAKAVGAAITLAAIRKDQL